MPSDLMMLVAALLAGVGPAQEAVSFPTSLQGQWTDDLSYCGGEDTGRMTVTAQSIQFYESVGTPTSVRADKNGAITAELNYRGEGKAWTESNRFAMSADKASVRVEALGRTFTLKRCAAVVRGKAPPTAG